MDYRSLATEYLSGMPLPGKDMRKKGLDGAHAGDLLLLCIEERGEVLPKELSDTMCVSTARVAIAINDLSDKGFITREIDGDDRRQIIVKLTDKGREHISAQRQKFIDNIAELFAELGEHDATEYVRLHAKVAEIMRKRRVNCCGDK